METKTKLRLSLVVNAIAIALIVSNCQSEPTTDACNLNPDCTVSKDQASLLAYTYQSKLPDDATSEGDKRDARSSWFSVEELEAFICIAKRQKEDKLFPGKLGIRFYYGRYPESNPNQSMNGFEFPEHYAGKHCLFLVPTYDVTIPKEDRAAFNGDTIYRQDFEVEGKNFLFSGTKRNHGALVPPENAEGTMFSYVGGQDVNP